MQKLFQTVQRYDDRRQPFKKRADMYLYAAGINWTPGRHSYIATIKAMTSAYIISLPQGLFKAIATAALFLVTIKKIYFTIHSCLFFLCILTG